MHHTRHTYRARPLLEPLERRDEPAADLTVGGRLPTADAPVWHALQVDEAGVLTAEATPGDGAGLRLTLVRGDDTVLMTSEGAAGAPLAGRITLHLAPGEYRLGVSAGRADAAYQLTAHVEEADTPAEPLDVPNPRGVAAGDFNGDTVPDLVAVSRITNTVTVWLGAGDGTFQPGRDFDLPGRPTAVVIADVNADTRPDLVTANADSVSVFLGDGQGDFAPRKDFPVAGGPVALAAGDLDGDGQVDIAVATGQAVAVLRGLGAGEFAAAVNFPELNEPSAVAVADVTGDGRADLIWAARQSGSVKVLPGGPAFDPAGQPTAYGVGLGPVAVAVADATGDGRADIVTADRAANTVTILRGQPDGTFTRLPALAAGLSPVGVTVADVNRDGRPDVVGANRDDTLDVFLGTGAGAFGPRRGTAAGSDQTAVATADFNRDGDPDLVVANGQPGQLRVLLGNGDGTFLTAGAFLVGPEPDAVAVGDVDGDGFADAVTANNAAGTIDVALGDGGGAFGPRTAVAVGGSPVSVSLADLNGDGRLDAVTADRAGGRVGVLLGNGDGAFRVFGSYPVGAGPQAVVAKDVDGDGIPDLVSADAGADTLSVLWGRGDGTFTDRVVVNVGDEPLAVAVADVTGDGRLDLISANKAAGTVSVVAATGQRVFASASDVDVGEDTFPVSVAVADVNGDGRADVVAGTLTGPHAVFLRTAAGDFQRAADVPAGGGTYGLIVADLDGDGRADVAATDVNAGTVGVARGRGDGSFEDPFTVPVGKGPIYLATADFNADGRPDLVAANSNDSTLGLLLGPFADADSVTVATPLRSAPPRHSPILLDLDGDGLTDSVVRDRRGVILFRKGQADPLKPFAAPRPLNTIPARDIAAVNVGGRMAIAALDLAPVDGSYTVSRYAVDSGGTISRDTVFTTQFLPTSLTAGGSALVVTHALDDRVTIALPGQSPVTHSTGDQPTAATLSDVDGDGRLDVLVSAAVSGDVTVIDGETISRFATGIDIAAADDDGAVFTPRHPVGSAAGNFFTGSGPADLAVLLDGSHQLAVLKNNGRGGFENPSATRMTPTTHDGTIADSPGPMVSGLFDGDAISDVAFLNRGSGEVWVWRGRGDGTFDFVDAVPAGESPSGLTLFGDDLYVGNPFGDVLRLTGNADGTFDPPAPLTGTNTALARTADGQVLVVNQKTGAASVRDVSAKGKVTTLTTVAAPNGAAPRAGLPVNLNGGSSSDIVVVEAGRNDVVVYRALEPDADGKPQFAAGERYAVGTAPVAATAGDVNGDGVQDLLVTNQGSNDVSVLFGNLAAGRWTATPGPRLRSGGLSPVGATLRDLDGDGRQELVVTNNLSGPGAAGGSLVAMTDRGFGYFDDARPQVTALPGPAVSAPVFTPRGGVIAVGDGLIGLNGLSPAGAAFAVGVRAVDALSDGRLVAYRDGGVELLAPDAAGVFQSVADLAPLTGIPSEPTALEVLETQSGFRVLVATAGSDQLFVFDVPPADLDGPPADSPVVSQTSVLGRDSLAVVVTLLAGGLPDSNAPADDAEAAADDGGEADGQDGVIVAGDDEEDAEAPPAEEAIPPSADAERELGRTRLYRPVDEAEDPTKKPPKKVSQAAPAPPVEEAVSEVFAEVEAPAEDVVAVTGTAASQATAADLLPAAAALAVLAVAARPATAKRAPAISPLGR